MTGQAITKKAVLERLWAELDRSQHQGLYGHNRYVVENGKVVGKKTNVRECGSCKRAVAAASVALKGLRFEIREPVQGGRP